MIGLYRIFTRTLSTDMILMTDIGHSHFYLLVCINTHKHKRDTFDIVEKMSM